ncbi:MAG: DUF1926 domain-containing protein [Candidatus Sumerlaeota bacterium]|nr:DUF1926 domain-containing protein [Candidatus Sumerlaeota bacterium]
MKTIRFIFALHNHQPIGNFDHVLEWAYQKAYRPFLDVFEAHPKITAVLHNSGCLAEWVLERHPDYFDRLRKLVEAGRLEIMTGGFYEPILPVIPERDRIGQIEKLTRFVKETTGYAAEGMWVAERVWEPHLPSTMRAAGVRYTVLDDSHFFASGLREDQTLGYYLTEDMGHSVAVFPTSKALRYSVPFAPVEKTIEWLRANATEEGTRLAILGDDGEKFGVWPETYEHVYEKGWLEEFFAALEQNADWIRLATFAEAMHAVPPLGRVYLPTASYVEMMTWALPPQSAKTLEEFREEIEHRTNREEVEPFVRGGFWRNFLAKYEESNHIHKRMLQLSEAVDHALRAAKAPTKRQRLEQARNLVWQAQCNCGYWHGVFGGLYLPHLRSALFERLIGAEAILRDQAPARVRVERVDFDGDAQEEVFVYSPALTLCFKPSQGGSLVEMDDLKTRVNICDTLTRRPEAYHAKVAKAVTWEKAAEMQAQAEADSTASIHDIVRAKEEGLESRLVYDWYRRASALARFLPGWTRFEDFQCGRYAEDGDFVNRPFDIEETRENKDGSAEVVLTRRGGVYQGGGVRWLTLRKRVRAAAHERGFALRHEMENTSKLVLSCYFGVEFVANFLAPDAHDRYVEIPGRELADRRLGAAAEDLDVEAFSLVDEWKGLRLTFELAQPATLWRLPIETISLSEAGFERVYQGACLLMLWPLSLEPGEKAAFELSVRMSKP